MAAAILLGIVQGEYVPFTAQLAPAKARLLVRGGDNMSRAYYLARARGFPSDESEVLLFWANDLYLAALEADPDDFRAALSAAILFRELGEPNQVRSLLAPVRSGQFDAKTKHVIAQVYALALTSFPARSAVDGSRRYLSEIGPGPLLTAAGYRGLNKPDLAADTLREAAQRSRPLVYRIIGAAVIDGGMVLVGLAMVVTALLRRGRPRAARLTLQMSPSWGAREAVEALVLWVFAGVLLSRLAGSMAPLTGDPSVYLLLGPSVVAAAVAIGWVWAVARLRAGLGWDFSRGISRIAVGIGATGLAALPVLGLYRLLQIRLGDNPSDNPVLPLLLIPDTHLAKVLLLIVVGLLVPALEETLFRGILFGGLRRHWSFWPAALAAAAVFAVVHLNAPGFAAYLLLGLLFALLFERSGSLVTSWAAHAAFNVFNLMVMFVLFG